jgi:hypothetical protein
VSFHQIAQVQVQTIISLVKSTTASFFVSYHLGKAIQEAQLQTAHATAHCKARDHHQVTIAAQTEATKTTHICHKSFAQDFVVSEIFKSHIQFIFINNSYASFCAQTNQKSSAFFQVQKLLLKILLELNNLSISS